MGGTGEKLLIIDCDTVNIIEGWRERERFSNVKINILRTALDTSI